MEKRIGTISIIIYRREIAQQVNEIISQYSDFILARQGLPLPDKGLNIITLIIETSSDKINALTGKIGRLKDVEVKSILSKNITNQKNQ
ncbi:MAG: TM1266 family iron-only hydrogenase system putative regulator [Bacteroidales bacterium]|jgi:putative iron-only hydrogenase system regulator|nr:TM1266 family iron-only hydrogenase system putative regulator [Bacteroidales bacterium]MEE1225846.1 TM1266 family iron-only hydrogenase system putative regulator [Bacteroidales bacterium]